MMAKILFPWFFLKNKYLPNLECVSYTGNLWIQGPNTVSKQLKFIPKLSLIAYARFASRFSQCKIMKTSCAKMFSDEFLIFTSILLFKFIYHEINIQKPFLFNNTDLTRNSQTCSYFFRYFNKNCSFNPTAFTKR